MKARTDAEHQEKMRKLKVAQDKKIASKTVEKGLVIVHTGTGKGKTSAALGMVVRAIGHGMKVGVIQFVKGAMQTGEKAVFDRFPDLVEWHVMGDGFTWDTQDRDRDIEAAEKALEKARELIAGGGHALVVLDEINIALRYDYLTPQAVIDVLEQRGDTRVILTGRDAPDELIDYADTVTEMTERKHAYHAGIRAQQGIDF